MRSLVSLRPAVVQDPVRLDPAWTVGKEPMLNRLLENLRNRAKERSRRELHPSLDDREDGEEAIENAAEIAQEGESPTMPRTKTDGL